MRFLKPVIATMMTMGPASLAMAADMAVPKPMMTPPAPAISEINWTGFYVGLNGGYGWTDSVTVSIADPRDQKSYRRSSSDMPGGFVGGGQLGYNWQSGHWVFGFEADIQYADLGGAVAWNGYDFLGLKSGDGQYFGTVRARLGYAVERSLFYLTGGFAYGGLIDNPLSGQSTSNQGYALGGGFEYAFTENWTGRVEGLYVNLENKAKTTSLQTSSGVYTLAAQPGDGAGLVRVGVNYKF